MEKGNINKYYYYYSFINLSCSEIALHIQWTLFYIIIVMFCFVFVFCFVLFLLVCFVLFYFYLYYYFFFYSELLLIGGMSAKDQMDALYRGVSTGLLNDICYIVISKIMHLDCLNIEEFPTICKL